MSQSYTYVSRPVILSELGISKYTWLRWARINDGFPIPLINSGRVPVYRREDIDAWLSGAKVEGV
jgi:predicted DNA-binding transcriptional regulator AlpA